MKFAHMGDCHLGGWRQPELRDLNFQSFKRALETCISEKVEFILISGDLFDSAYPPIEILKETFKLFRLLRDNNIPVFLIAGSHDFSASGKTFLDVLENSGFCKNVSIFEEREKQIILLPTIHKNYAIYGYSGKKAGLEMPDISKLKMNDSPGLFKILMLHTAIKDALRSDLMDSIDHKLLPKYDYLALSHLHIKYQKENRAYSGPIFPNNMQELEEIKTGSFCIFDNGRIIRKEIKIKDLVVLDLELSNAFTATSDIISALSNEVLFDKIVLLKLFGSLNKGNVSDIDFAKIENYIKDKKAFSFLRSTTKLHSTEPEINIEFSESINLEEKIVEKFINLNPNKFNRFIPDLLNALQIEKLEEEKLAILEDRVFSETRKVFSI